MNTFARIIVSASLMTLLIGGALAQGKTAPIKEAAKCEACGMTLSAKKTKACPVAVKGKDGKIVGYCCSHCKMKK